MNAPESPGSMSLEDCQYLTECEGRKQKPTTPIISSSESSRVACLAGGELRSDATASLELSFSTPRACGRKTSCNREDDDDICMCE